jgi:Chromo (CHRromatin Organisation MOdifier) domain
VTYRLKLPESWRIHNVFHATLLQPYIKNEVYGNNYPRPLPELLEGEEVYKVETILKHQKRGRGYQYYVKWKGYPNTEATWENESAFSNNGNMITIQRPISTIDTDWTIRNKRLKKKKNDKNLKKY